MNTVTVRLERRKDRTFRARVAQRSAAGWTFGRDLLRGRMLTDVFHARQVAHARLIEATPAGVRVPDPVWWIEDDAIRAF